MLLSDLQIDTCHVLLEKLEEVRRFPISPTPLKGTFYARGDSMGLVSMHGVIELVNADPQSGAPVPLTLPLARVAGRQV
ncbi:MAG TPA: hypothetical protein VGL53_21085 [Bryobacteraceae bacterium]|jgi:hypothetical protein